MLKQSLLLKALPWGDNFTVALDDEWDVIEHPELPNIPYLKEYHTPELLTKYPKFAEYLNMLFPSGANTFVEVPADVTLETFYDFIDTLY